MPAVDTGGQAGLFDVVPHPDYAKNGWLYLAFSDMQERDGRKVSLTKIVRGRIRDGATGQPACDHVNRLEDDLDLLAWLGVDAYRFSISWPRVQPGGDGPLSAEGLGF